MSGITSYQMLSLKIKLKKFEKTNSDLEEKTLLPVLFEPTDYISLLEQIKQKDRYKPKTIV